MKTDAKIILAVDDDTGMLETIKIVFSKRYYVPLARNGMDALHTMKESDIDLVLLDIIMPEMDGTKVLSEGLSQFAVQSVT